MSEGFKVSFWPWRKGKSSFFYSFLFHLELRYKLCVVVISWATVYSTTWAALTQKYKQEKNWSNIYVQRRGLSPEPLNVAHYVQLKHLLKTWPIAGVRTSVPAGQCLSDWDFQCGRRLVVSPPPPGECSKQDIGDWQRPLEKPWSLGS